MSYRARIALIALVVLSFAGSAGLLLVATRWLHGTAAAATLLARAASRVVGERRAPASLVTLTLGCDEDAAAGATAVSASFFTGDDAELPFAIVEGGDGSQTSMVMNHETPGLRRLLRDRGADVIWFERDGSEYVIRDAGTFARAKRIVEPMESLGRAMGELGGRMGRIGAQQGRLGGEMGRLGARLGRLEVRRADVRMNGGDDPAVEREIREVRAAMDRLREQMDGSGDRTDLREAQYRMQELRGRHVGVMKHVREQMRSLIDESLRTGRAQRLDSGV